MNLTHSLLLLWLKTLLLRDCGLLRSRDGRFLGRGHLSAKPLSQESLPIFVQISSLETSEGRTGFVKVGQRSGSRIDIELLDSVGASEAPDEVSIMIKTYSEIFEEFFIVDLAIFA